MCKEYVEDLNKININANTIKINDFVVNVDNNIMDGYYIVKKNNKGLSKNFINIKSLEKDI